MKSDIIPPRLRQKAVVDKCLWTIELIRHFKRAIKNRPKDAQFMVDGYSRFLFLNQAGLPKVAGNYESMLRGLVKKYNKTHDEPLPHITPHTFRHTSVRTWQIREWHRTRYSTSWDIPTSQWRWAIMHMVLSLPQRLKWIVFVLSGTKEFTTILLFPNGKTHRDLRIYVRVFPIWKVPLKPIK